MNQESLIRVVLDTSVLVAGSRSRQGAVLELALAAGCRHIITHNVADFGDSEQLGVTALKPLEFLKKI
jgi:hypothetical protein